MRINLLLLIIQISMTGVYSQCSCNQYGTQNGCKLQPITCIWDIDSQSCIDQSPQIIDCQFQSQDNCLSPYCYWNGECQYFANCSSLPVQESQMAAMEICSMYNCVNTFDNGCQSISNCNYFIYSEFCTNRDYPSSGQVIECIWDGDNVVYNFNQLIKNTCLNYNGCSSLSSSQCQLLPQKCFLSSNQCRGIDCSDLISQQTCTLTQCIWQKGVCIQKTCSEVSQQDLCNGQLNNSGYCAWSGSKCVRCAFQNILKPIMICLMLYILL